ncbi:MAG: hypothetical protein IJ547_00645 [Clostridia bacterium]|nr:hypothetical protein [Clostridia bacterium]
MPQGHLCVVKPKGSHYVQYYHATYGDDGKEIRTYLSKQDDALIRQLAQKEYDRKVTKAAKRELQTINRFLNAYPARLPEDVYNSYMEERRELITPIVTPWEAFAEQWQAARYEPNPYPMEKSFPTARGELVRSKSEVEIANYLYYRDIPYRYECPLRLKDGQKTLTLYPDFTILDRATREVVLLEHLGRMDDPGYVNRVLEKRRVYEEHGFFEGENILYTWESGEHPLTRRQVERKLEHRLKR